MIQTVPLESLQVSTGHDCLLLMMDDLDMPPTAENINAAIQWLRVNEQMLSQSLPIETPGVTYNCGWLMSLERRVRQWEAEEMPLNLAVCYILLPLRVVKKGLRDRT